MWRPLTERMLRLTQDGALRQRLGQAIFEKVKREFSIDATVRTQVEIYETILRRLSHRRGPEGGRPHLRSLWKRQCG